MSTQGETTAKQVIEIESAFQDEIISKRLPAWLRSVRPEHLDVLGNALNKSLGSRQLVDIELGQMQGIDSFCSIRLRQKLKTTFNLDVDPHKLWYRDANRKPVTSWAPIRVPLTEPDYFQAPLLEATLYNFTLDETKPFGQPKGNGLYTEAGARLLSPSAQEFASLCRELDLGKQYQTHLSSCLDKAAVKYPLQDMLRYSMLVDAFEARHEEVLSESELKFLIRLCNDGYLAELDNNTVIPKQLHILGYEMKQIVLFDIRDKPLILPPSTQRLLAYIPGDPLGAWSAWSDLEDFNQRLLGARLRQPEYQSFFARFVRRRDTQGFFSPIISGYNDLPVWAHIDLKTSMSAYSMPLFGTLVTEYIQQKKDDAASIITPVADLDRAIQAQHDKRLATEKMALLYLAAAYVPAISWILLAVTAWKLLREVFQSVEAWHDGDRTEAWEHMTHVAKDVAQMTALGLGAGAVKNIWNRSQFVDRLVPARLADETERLWNEDVSAFREVLPSTATVDEEGVWRQGEQAWVWMDGHYYPVLRRPADGQWQLRPLRGHGPLLQYNGAGAWRLWTEQPSEWAEPHQLFRRLGERFAGFDDQQIDEVMQAQGLDADQLRAMHVNDKAPDGELLDTMERRRLAQRIAKLVASLRSNAQITDVQAMQAAGYMIPNAGILDRQSLAEQIWTMRRPVFQHFYQTLQEPDDEGANTLRRQFSSLHHEAAKTLISEASPIDRQRVLDSGRIPLRLAEAARASVTRIRLARVYEALLFDTTQNADLARTALSMLKYLPGDPSAIRWRLYEDSLDGPLLLTTENGEQTFDLVHQDGSFQLFDNQGDAVSEPDELFTTLTMAYQADQLQSMGVTEPTAVTLQHAVLRQASQRREEVDRLLRHTEAPGWFNTPSRQPSDRLGYPLNGYSPSGSPSRRSPRALNVRLRQIYPTRSNVQVNMWISQQGSEQAAAIELQRLERELRTLNNSLRNWADQGRTYEQRVSRHQLRRQLRDCWQRRIDADTDPSVLSVNRRFTMADHPTGALPEIPENVRFEHVFVISLRRMGLTQMPDSFALAFPNLQILELDGNNLLRLPQPLMQMQRLARLVLADNQITLDAAQSTILASCEQLVYLDLSRNPLGRTFSLSGMPRLRNLHLASTGIDRLPYHVLESTSLRYVDLHDNLISELPADFYSSRLWNEGSMYLFGNPLSPTEAERMQEALFGREEGAAANPAPEDPTLVRWYQALDERHRPTFGTAWAAVEGRENSFGFFRLLSRLQHTAEFRTSIRAPLLAIRVLSMLQAMQADETLSQVLFRHAMPTSCEDSAALIFSDMEVHVRAHRAVAHAGTLGRERALLRLGRQLWRLDQVDGFAWDDIFNRLSRSLPADDVEIILAYRLGLRTRLRLPALTTEMLYRPSAHLDEAVVRRVGQLVLSRETDEELAQSLLMRRFWRQHLATAYRARFDALNAPFHRRLETVLDNEDLLEAERDSQSRQIAEEQLTAKRALKLRLTRELLETANN